MSNLGRGLSSLLGDAEEVYNDVDSTVKLEEKEMSVNNIVPGQYQPRKSFNEEHLKSLSESIKKNGILQPLLVRNIGDKYEIIAGERRFKAAKLAGLESVPVVIKNFSDKQTIEIALIENLQREDLSPIEEAWGYKRMMNEFNYTQEEVGKAVDKSRSHVANIMRLLNLPDSIKELLENGDISIGHARALLTAENAEELAQLIVKKQLSVRQIEKLIAAQKNGSKEKSINSQIRVENMSSSDIVASIEKKLKLNAFVDQTGYYEGRITISYNSLEELTKLLKVVGK